jgi:phage tail P2-like protein
VSYDPFPFDPNPYPAEVTEAPGAQTLYRAATGFEKALADVDAERIMNIHAELVTAQWDPYAISYQNLPYLAWAMGVNLWEDIWAEGSKRDWVARQWQFKAVRGAPTAYRMALGMSGYELTDMVRPPQGTYAAPDLTKEEQDAWIRQMPEIRIYWAHREGTRGVDEIFADYESAVSVGPAPHQLGDPGDFNDTIEVANTGFADQDAVSINDGWVLRGRYAIIRHRGVDTPLNVVEYAPGVEELGVVDYERVSTVGRCGIGGYFADEDAPDTQYVCFEEIKPKLITLRLDRNYSHDASALSLSMITASLTPITPRYERNSDVGDGDACSFVNDHADGPPGADFFADPKDGGDRLLADQIYLLDPDVTEVMVEGISFSDWSRVGLPPYLAEIQIDLRTSEGPFSTFCEDHYAEVEFVVPEDDSHRERAFRAVLASKALRDSILVSFDPVRPIEMGDILTDDSRYGDWVRNLL